MGVNVDVLVPLVVEVLLGVVGELLLLLKLLVEMEEDVDGEVEVDVVAALLQMQ